MLSRPFIYRLWADNVVAQIYSFCVPKKTKGFSIYQNFYSLFRLFSLVIFFVWFLLFCPFTDKASGFCWIYIKIGQKKANRSIWFTGIRLNTCKICIDNSICLKNQHTSTSYCVNFTGLIISKYFQTHKHFDAFSIKTGLYTIHHLCKHFNFMISFEIRVFCIENEAHYDIVHWAKNNVIGTKSTGLFVWTSTNYCRNSLMRKRPETQIQIGLSIDIIRLKTSMNFFSSFFWRNVFDWINFDSLFNNKNRFYFSIISV